MRTPFVFACGFFALTGCTLVGCASPSDAADDEQSAHGIVGGELASSPVFDAVVALTEQSFQFCTGTLIAPDIVLTAEHCIEGRDLDLDPIEVRVGVAVDEPTASEMVESMIAVEGEPKSGTMGYGSDVAFLRLRAPIEGVTPIPMLSRALKAEDRGKLLLAVGFGRTTAAEDGSDNPKGLTRSPDKRYMAPGLLTQVSGKPAWSYGAYSRMENWLASHGYPKMNELWKEQQEMDAEEASRNADIEAPESTTLSDGDEDASGKRPHDKTLYEDYEAIVEDRGAGYTCQGDSGGPHLLKLNGQYVVAGVTSGAPALGRVGCLPGLTYIGTFGPRVLDTRASFMSR